MRNFEKSSFKFGKLKNKWRNFRKNLQGDVEKNLLIT